MYFDAWYFIIIFFFPFCTLLKSLKLGQNAISEVLNACSLAGKVSEEK